MLMGDQVLNIFIEVFYVKIGMYCNILWLRLWIPTHSQLSIIQRERDIIITIYILKPLPSLFKYDYPLYYYYIGLQNVFKIWCSYQVLCLFNVAVTANIYIFVDTKRNYRDLWEKKEKFVPENIYIHGMEVTTERNNIEADLVINDL